MKYKIIGSIIILDGILSLYFTQSKTELETAGRCFRIATGLYLL